MAGIARICRRNFSTSTARFSAAHGEDPAASMLLWKRLTLFVGFPCIALSGLHAYLKETEHHERPEFIPYEHLRIRRKRFPWGDGNKSLFHNPHMNALPDGYEDEH